MKLFLAFIGSFVCQVSVGATIDERISALETRVAELEKVAKSSWTCYAFCEVSWKLRYSPQYKELYATGDLPTSAWEKINGACWSFRNSYEDAESPRLLDAPNFSANSARMDKACFRN